MKIVATNRNEADVGKIMTDVERNAVLHEISIALMDHGSVVLKSGTLESAAILQSWLSTTPE